MAISKDDNFKTTVYNIEVEDFHTYFVGELGIWVHNSCEIPTRVNKFDVEPRNSERATPIPENSFAFNSAVEASGYAVLHGLWGKIHILIHNSPWSRLTHELETDDAVHDALEADPDGFDAWLAVAFARQEAAEHGDQSQDLIESGPVSRRLLLVEEIGGMPFILVEEHVGGQVRTGPAESH